MSHTANALANETSPYLLQHAHNPVAWYPWGAQALERARLEDKPILLSIGYSACHWCHVMAHESFEDAETAALMNAHFINIKVDREERPDLDKIYQTAQHLITQRSGGWPLTMFLSPRDQTPFFGGTYFPRESHHGLPGFKDLLRHISEAYHSDPQGLREHGLAVQDALQRLAEQDKSPAGPRELGSSPLLVARQQIGESYEPRHGGFSGAPKFPHPPTLERLFRHYAASIDNGSPDRESLHMALFTLERMAAGGIYDHLGGGFCRYSVDAYWMIPHFEKMLYDNALLLPLYCAAWQLSGDPAYRAVATETADWVMRDMQSPEGGYYSSLDADSEGEEGSFYVWTREELETVLNEGHYAPFAKRYGLDKPANFEGKWHLRICADIPEVAKTAGLEAGALSQNLDDARRRLLSVRNARVWPGRDQKVLSSWNALMIKGMAVAGRVLQQENYLRSAERALDFIHDTMWREGRLLATYKDGKAHLDAYLDDHAFLIDAVLALLQARWRQGDLEFAVELAQALLERFEDAHAGGFYFTAHDHEPLIQRAKSLQDDAVPSGAGIAAHVLTRLGYLLGETKFLNAALRALQSAWSAIEHYPSAYNAMLLALEEYLLPPETIVIRGDSEAIEAWHARCVQHYAPRRMVLAIPGSAPELPSALREKRPGAATVAYVCGGHQCRPPITEWSALEAILGQGPASAVAQ
ncbi:MAG: thioredoxin domain-containing protein [Gammaproteobacteria bacterium]